MVIAVDRTPLSLMKIFLESPICPYSETDEKIRIPDNIFCNYVSSVVS
jgi:hypothetical protein